MKRAPRRHPNSYTTMTSRILILGGTRNLGHVTAVHLLQSGHNVTVLNRGVTRDELPDGIERIRATRGDGSVMASIGGREFDSIIDLTTYNRADAMEAVEAFRNRAGRYVFISSGQVYLVLKSAQRPFREQEYAGDVMPAPPDGTDDFDSWKYGVDKRDAEDVFIAAFENENFPVTTLRLPMVASERDHYGRLQGYFARMSDGEPLLIPDGRGLPIRHVYVHDVARFVGALCGVTGGIGKAYNVSYGFSKVLSEYLALLGDVLDKEACTMIVPRAQLVEAQLLPDCSPFSGAWMSELDASLASEELIPGGFEYTSPEKYLPLILEDYRVRWIAQQTAPATYSQRDRELAFLSKL
ncbi:MAG TPA: NAD-dependent epimerase/dehydratase family protein [Gemmatimonadaceae bacterium]|nr:NAD-dependent epimerase/dehydratase family protein [Gemmatimonadaceae bacterium]